MAALLFAPGRLAAQEIEIEPSFDADAVLELDLSSLPEAELDALSLRAETERNARHAELPALEVMPWVMIPIGGLTAIAGQVTFAYGFEGPVALAYTGGALIVTGIVLVLSGVAWVIERGITTRRHPSWPAYRRAARARERLRVEQRARERRRLRLRPRQGRHPRRSPWH